MVERAIAGGATVVAPDPAERVLVWVGFPLLGAGLGALLPALAGWARSLRWIPFRWLVNLVGSHPGAPATIVGIAVGLAVGLVMAQVAEEDYVTVTVADDQLTIAHGGYARSVPRASIHAAFLDRKQLVLLGSAGAEVARTTGDLNVARLPAALLAHGYPWLPAG